VVLVRLRLLPSTELVHELIEYRRDITDESGMTTSPTS